MKVVRLIGWVAAAHLLFAPSAFALAPAWKIVPERSSLIFVGTQNGAPAKGEFKKFSGEINFDLNQLQDSKIRIIVDMNSITTSYADVAVTLKTPEWFDIKLFPEAIFEASHFVKVGDKQYEAQGSLTIRDKTLPVTLTFIAEQPTGNSALVKGYTTLKRTAFGIGQGEWASADEVKDDVRVDFVVSATK